MSANLTIQAGSETTETLTDLASARHQKLLDTPEAKKLVNLHGMLCANIGIFDSIAASFEAESDAFERLRPPPNPIRSDLDVRNMPPNGSRLVGVYNPLLTQRLNAAHKAARDAGLSVYEAMRELIDGPRDGETL